MTSVGASRPMYAARSRLVRSSVARLRDRFLYLVAEAPLAQGLHSE
jgi:hypothetical protein